ncbi:amidophosphoribosyltransferase [Basfia succiniciproducens]|uniref:ComF family protein n=1 Tax=Basfia succiniciproducens TaxID=653940 RepID=A0A1G5D861_9PAST|nr:amidophosphoribosyltransferase [Basfia succiniciproducens]QIM69361.1 amidophosphoribosyltransferase [Basfia succiniciproducens]SCY10620.1 comF family protein [Basfia succiniciproducens]
MNWFAFRCIYCQKKLAIGSHGLCCSCNKQIRRFNYCGVCGSELAENTLGCGNCLQNRPAWHRMVIIGAYKMPLSSLIHRFKFQNSFYFDRTLARLLYLAIRDARRTHGLMLPEVIIPVPLHHFRHWRRGYNQADLLAGQLAKWLNIPCNNRLIKRVKHTRTQRGLSAAARRVNLRKAFRFADKKQACPYKSVALVDDVITTGSTLNALAGLFVQQGVEQIQVWGLARA